MPIPNETNEIQVAFLPPMSGLAANEARLDPGAILLLDEPDAHLEILRQRQIYQYLSDIARENNNQIIAASHSEILLNEAADRDVVIAFLGKPHRMNDRGSQLMKSLKDIGFEQYYQAEQTHWVLYLEGSNALAILRAFAESRIKRMHEAIEEIKDALEKLSKGSPWDDNTKVSDDFLTPLFENYFKKLNLPNIIAKKNFHELARYVPLDKIVPEINEKLDAIARIANSASAQ